jgi:excisionase family DNA binding protein
MHSSKEIQLLSVPQVAGILNVSIKTVRRLLGGEQLHFHRVGSTIRVSRDDLRAYVNGTRQ